MWVMGRKGTEIGASACHKGGTGGVWESILFSKREGLELELPHLSAACFIRNNSCRGLRFGCYKREGLAKVLVE